MLKKPLQSKKTQFWLGFCTARTFELKFIGEQTLALFASKGLQI